MDEAAPADNPREQVSEQVRRLFTDLAWLEDSRLRRIGTPEALALLAARLEYRRHLPGINPQERIARHHRETYETSQQPA